MPLTKRQFDLGIDNEIENWMRHIYDLLAGHRDLAYSSHELSQAILGEDLSDYGDFSRALDALVELGAVDERKVTNTFYYAFLQEFDSTTWKQDLGIYRV